MVPQTDSVPFGIFFGFDETEPRLMKLPIRIRWVSHQKGGRESSDPPASILNC